MNLQKKDYTPKLYKVTVAGVMEVSYTSPQKKISFILEALFPSSFLSQSTIFEALARARSAEIAARFENQLHHETKDHSIVFSYPEDSSSLRGISPKRAKYTLFWAAIWIIVVPFFLGFALQLINPNCVAQLNSNIVLGHELFYFLTALSVAIAAGLFEVRARFRSEIFSTLFLQMGIVILALFGMSDVWDFLTLSASFFPNYHVLGIFGWILNEVVGDLPYATLTSFLFGVSLTMASAMVWIHVFWRATSGSNKLWDKIRKEPELHILEKFANDPNESLRKIG